MNIPKVKDLVTGDKKADFVRFQDNTLWYQCEDGFEFPISTTEAEGAVFLPVHKAITLMRWIRKHTEFLARSVAETK